jgi:hypothetical protein
VTTRAKRWLLIAFDVSGLVVAWAMFGTRRLPYFIVAFAAIYCLGHFIDRKDQPE